jgi:hypothetical protein
VAIIIASAILSSRVSRVSRGPEPQADADALTGFVMLPEAAALPAFESGRIVRVAVPLASLPAFGLEVIPDAAATQVEADLLVGQDGLPRAIRLASTISPYTPYRSR